MRDELLFSWAGWGFCWAFFSLLCARVRHTLVSWKGCILKAADEAELLVQGYGKIDIFFFI